MVAVAFAELPSYDDVVRRFSLFDSGRTACDTQIGEGGSLRCDCHGCTDWYAFLGGKLPYSGGAQYEVFTKEHLQGLAAYLRGRAKGYDLSVMDVLEVGAGNGRLAYHLGLLLARSQAPEAEAAVIHLRATDKGVGSVGVVTREDAVAALSRVQPQVVIASWMQPMGVDWTAHMRATDSVLEYILIGETDDGVCGEPLLTWGFDPFGDSSEESGDDADDEPVESRKKLQAYGMGARNWRVCGWDGVDIPELSRYQICRTDERWSVTRHSRTVSFRRHR